MWLMRLYRVRASVPVPVFSRPRQTGHPHGACGRRMAYDLGQHVFLVRREKCALHSGGRRFACDRRCTHSSSRWGGTSSSSSSSSSSSTVAVYDPSPVSEHRSSVVVNNGPVQPCITHATVKIQQRLARKKSSMRTLKSPAGVHCPCDGDASFILIYSIVT
jgi:hypothetical protein